jgi:hypothetical protein
MSRKRALKREESDGIREITLGAYKASRIEVNKTEDGRNRRIRNRMCGGEGGRRARALLLPDFRLRITPTEYNFRRTKIRVIYDLYPTI